MSYNFAAMDSTTALDYFFEEPKFQEKKIRNFKELLKYAETKYGCVFSDGFEEEITSDWSDTFKLLDKKIVDALVKEWNIWKPYVNPDSFNSFMEDGLKCLFQIKTTATFCSEKLKGYIGNKATIIKTLPSMLNTCITSRGTLFINGKPA